ncbi:putative transcriptional regulatory protein TcrX [Aquisphaera giovannonii]|uniref:histidine kinase n=1 Tax=Aquisphaera giovannonii TaxID=406548 RepID=A0A5B9W3E5_9BACT|nr:response regulator [Aquisphaera giovannonii]QEH34769.1 putative transcriptional regulatory protein TcrX [Aquisphaera giovannonii]
MTESPAPDDCRSDHPSSGGGEAPARREAAPKPTRRRILVVDDNPDMARSLSLLLEVLGHDVTTALGGEQAIGLAKGSPPEFILMDIGLPIMNGYQVAARLREEVPGLSAVFVAISGYSQEEDRRRSREAGFAHHLVKPVDYDEILRILAAGTGPVAR